MSMMIDRRGAVAVLAAMMLSVLAGIGALGSVGNFVCVRS